MIPTCMHLAGVVLVWKGGAFAFENWPLVLEGTNLACCFHVKHLPFA